MREDYEGPALSVGGEESRDAMPDYSKMTSEELEEMAEKVGGRYKMLMRAAQGGVLEESEHADEADKLLPMLNAISAELVERDQKDQKAEK